MWLTIWSIAGYRKPMNWISATGFRPCVAMPTLMPAIIASASGVSCTRSWPKRSARPAVARNTPPFAPTSWPSTITAGSACISHACASAIASTIVTFGMRLVAALRAARTGIAARDVALPGQMPRRFREQVVEHAVGRLFRRRQVLGHRRLDEAGAFLVQQLFRCRIPRAGARQVGAQAHERLGEPGLFHLVGAAIAARVVGGRMVAEPVGQRLDERWPAAAARGLQRPPDDVANRKHVVAVDLDAGYLRGDAFLRQRPGRGLLRERQ